MHYRCMQCVMVFISCFAPQKYQKPIGGTWGWQQHDQERRSAINHMFFWAQKRNKNIIKILPGKWLSYMRSNKKRARNISIPGIIVRWWPEVQAVFHTNNGHHHAPMYSFPDTISRIGWWFSWWTDGIHMKYIDLHKAFDWICSCDGLTRKYYKCFVWIIYAHWTLRFWDSNKCVNELLFGKTWTTPYTFNIYVQE